MVHSKPQKMSLEQVIRFVELLSAREQEQLRQKLNGDAQNQAQSVSKQPFLDWRIDIDSLAKDQGVSPCTSIEALKGDFWPPDEDLDEFVATIREGRRESNEHK